MSASIADTFLMNEHDDFTIVFQVSFLCSTALGGVQDVLAFLGTSEFTQICGVVANGFAMMDPALKNSPSYRVVLAGEASVQVTLLKTVLIAITLLKLY